MQPLIRDVSKTPGDIVIIVQTDHVDSALRYTLTYSLQRVGYANTISDIKITPLTLKKNSRSADAILCPDDEIILATEKVLRYFQYAKKHLLTQRNHPHTYKKWSEDKRAI